LPTLAVDLAEHVMQQHVRRARRIRARVIADHRVESECRLDRRRLEPAIEHLARALREKIQHVALSGEIERAEALRDFPRLEHRADARPTEGGVASRSSRSTSATRSSIA
jgi:hypothetical protein